jgi:hypothetical protein
MQVSIQGVGPLRFVGESVPHAVLDVLFSDERNI